MIDIKDIAVLNDSNKDIVNFPIEEAKVDDNGRPVLDLDTQQWVVTGKTNVWNLPAGERKIFPRYVGEYLIKTYGFLKEVKVVEEEVAPEEKLEEGKARCPYCKVVFSEKGLPMHISSKHKEELLKK